jgi:hypothetical protein
VHRNFFDNGTGVLEKKVFISYTRKDLAWGEWIAGVLKDEAGLAVELDVWDWNAGDDVIEKMDRAVSGCTLFLMVMSHAYFTSPYAEAEWKAVLARHFSGDGCRLIPVRIDDVEPPVILKSFLSIDLYKVDESAARDRLLEQAAGRPGKPSTLSPFPCHNERVAAEKPGPRFPGALPKIWNVPYRRNRNFTGREEVISRLEEALLSGARAAVTGTGPRAVTGLGGIGKTQTALEYVYRHVGEYDTIWWCGVRMDNRSPTATCPLPGLPTCLKRMPGKKQ